MKITVDVARAEQTYDLNKMQAQYYLVFVFAGVESRVPCTEAQLVEAIRECAGAATTVPAPAPVEAVPQPRVFTYSAEQADEELKPVSVAPAVFSTPDVVEAPSRPVLRPVSRPVSRGDDVGIQQG